MLETELKPIRPAKRVQQLAARPARLTIVAARQIAQSMGEGAYLFASPSIETGIDLDGRRCTKRNVEATEEPFEDLLIQARSLKELLDDRLPEARAPIGK